MKVEKKVLNESLRVLGIIQRLLFNSHTYLHEFLEFKDKKPRRS